MADFTEKIKTWVSIDNQISTCMEYNFVIYSY